MAVQRKTKQDDDSETEDRQADSFVIDFSEVEELSEEPLPLGSYLIEVRKAELGKAADGKPFIQLTTFVVEPQEHAGRKLTDRIWLTKDSMWRAKKAFRALGFDVEGKLDLSEIVVDVVGREVDVLTKIDTLPLDGRKVARINRFIPPNENDEDTDTEF
jgi:hypothetical protein